MHPSHDKERVGAGTKMVCGMGDQVSKMSIQETQERVRARIEAQESRVSGVLAVVVLSVILFALGECLWER